MIKVNKAKVKIKGNEFSIAIDLINLLYNICNNDEFEDTMNLVKEFTDIDFDNVKENIEKKLKGIKNNDKTRDTKSH